MKYPVAKHNRTLYSTEEQQEAQAQHYLEPNDFHSSGENVGSMSVTKTNGAVIKSSYWQHLQMCTFFAMAVSLVWLFCCRVLQLL